MCKKQTLLFILFLMIPLSAQAYIGPGVGTGTIAVVFGIISSVFLAIFAIFWYPFKRLIKRLKGQKPEVDESESNDK
ncbi:MAG: hypothetical protein QNL04_07790 [SAR324 cluster bacterium]|nr:hypothetical protein [SAR324 cluster bacterium]